MGWTKIGNVNDGNIKVRYGKTYKKVGNVRDSINQQNQNPTAKKQELQKKIIDLKKQVLTTKIAKLKAKTATPPPRISYEQAVDKGRQAEQFSKSENSVFGMAKNFIKKVPQATADTLVGTPAKFIASAVEMPQIILKNGKTHQREYKIPGLSPFKSYQSDFANISNDVIEGEKGLGSAVWGMAQVPLAGLETAGIAKGIGKTAGAFNKAGTAGQKLANAGAELADTFIPTTRGIRGQLPIQKLASDQNIPQQIVSRQNVPTNILESSYTPRVAQESGNVNSQVLAQRADEIINPTKAKSKERGFVETVKNSPELSQDLASRVDDTYNVKHNEAGIKKAQQLIFDNPTEAERIAMSGGTDEATFTANELIKHYDEIATKSKATGNSADFEVAMGKAVDIARQNARNLTEAGRTVQAASTIDRLSPDGIIQYVNKAIKEVGGESVKLSNEKYYNIVRQAEAIKGILDPKKKALATFDLLDNIYADIPKSLQNKVSEALNLPRSIMATADLSAPLRQGIFTMARNPKMFAKNFGSMLKYAFSEDAYRNLKADIVTSPNYDLYKKHKLSLTDINQGLTNREEEFMSNWAEKIPLFGKLAKGSNRAYSGFLNKMRMDLFDNFVETAKLEGITDAKFFDDAATFVGSATGRGKLWKGVDEHASLLNGIFFSPRLMASRLNLINPVYYAKLHPTVRKEALKYLASFVGTGMSVLALAKLNGAEVGTDPRSADFGKIKMGNTRYDIWGGFQQYARLIGQLTTGEKISTTTGKQTELGSGGYNAPTRESIFIDFLKSKANPLTSFAIRASQGKQFGEEFNLPAEVLDRFIPMIAQDAFDLSREYGAEKGLPMAIPGAFGVGSMTYGDQIPKMTTTPSGAPSIEYRSQPGLGETIINKATGKQVSDIPKEQWEALAREKLTEQKRQVQLDALKQEVLLTGESKTLDDTLIYLENGVIKTKKLTKEEKKVKEKKKLQEKLKPIVGETSRTPIKDEILYQALEERKNNSYYQ